MTLDQLHAFVTAADAGSFRKAAQLLRRTQPAVSMAVRKLEQEFDTRFFSRDAYRPSLTAAGRAFYEKAKALLDQAQELQTLGRNVAHEEPEIRVVLDIVCPFPPVLALIEEFSSHHPETRVNLQIESLMGPQDRVLSGDADLALTTAPRAGVPLETLPLVKVTMIPCIAREAAPLRAGALTLARLREFPQVIIPDTGFGPKVTVGVLGGGHSITVNDMYAKREIVRAGLGWGGLPEHLIGDDLKKGRLVPIELGRIRPITFPMFALRRDDRLPGPVARRLWEFLRARYAPPSPEGRRRGARS